VIIQFLLSITLSRVHHVSIGGDSSSGVDHSAMISGGRGRGRGRGCDHGQDSGGGYGRGDKDLRHCAHCDRNNHTSDK